MVGQGDNPTKRPVKLKGRDRNLERQQTMEPEVSLPLLRDRRESEAGDRWRGRPPPLRPRGVATKPVLEGADRIEAQLAPVVVNAKIDHGSFSGLRPLPATSSRGQIAPIHRFPQSSHHTRSPSAAVTFDKGTDGGSTRDKDSPMPARGKVADVYASGDEARQQLVGLAPSASPDGVLGFIGNDNRRVSLQVEGATFIRNERGGIVASPTNPAQGGNQRGGGASRGRPPRAFGMCKLVPGMVEGVLEVLPVEPPVPNRKSPLNNREKPQNRLIFYPLLDPYWTP